MISISLSLALFLYALVVVLFAIFAIVNVYHLVHYGATSGISFAVTFLFLAGAAFILFFTYHALAAVDWNQQIGIGIPFVSSPSSLEQP
jgi:hypothetical protein